MILARRTETTINAGVDIARVAYKGTGLSVIGLYSGEVVVMFAGMGSVAQHIKAGKLRALAVTTPKPTPPAPGLPTVGETVPGYSFVAEIGVYAPGGAPRPSSVSSTGKSCGFCKARKSRDACSTTG